MFLYIILEVRAVLVSRVERAQVNKKQLLEKKEKEQKGGQKWERRNEKKKKKKKERKFQNMDMYA